MTLLERTQSINLDSWKLDSTGSHGNWANDLCESKMPIRATYSENEFHIPDPYNTLGTQT